jgi:hypothetical protein
MQPPDLSTLVKKLDIKGLHCDLYCKHYQQQAHKLKDKRYCFQPYLPHSQTHVPCPSTQFVVLSSAERHQIEQLRLLICPQQ